MLDNIENALLLKLVFALLIIFLLILCAGILDVLRLGRVVTLLFA